MGVKRTSFLFKVKNAYVCLSIAILSFFVSFHLWKDYRSFIKCHPLFYRQNRKYESSHGTWNIGVYRIPIVGQNKSMGSSKLDLGRCSSYRTYPVIEPDLFRVTQHCFLGLLSCLSLAGWHDPPSQLSISRRVCI